MDLLKRAQRNLEDVGFENGNKFVVIGEKRHDGEMLIDMPNNKSKRYTLASLVFFLKNDTLSYAEYVASCQREGIPSIGYLEQSMVKKEIGSYKGNEIRGSFGDVIYTSNNKYEIPPLDARYYIVVSGSVLSPINVSNAPLLLSADMDETRDRGNNHREMKRGDNTFIFTGDTGAFRESDWERVRAVFTDGKEGSLGQCEEILHKHMRNVVVFTTGSGPDYAQHVHVTGGGIDDLPSVWGAIMQNVHT